MNCTKKIVLTGYRVQFVDLREPKPRTPRELIHVADKAWLDALGRKASCRNSQSFREGDV